MTGTTLDITHDSPEIIPDEPLKNKLMRNGFWLYFFAALIVPSGYLIKMFASRSLSVEEMGLFYTAMGFISLLASYNDMGLTEALQYFLPKYVLRNETVKAKTLIWTTIALQCISGIIIGGGLYVTAPWLAEHYFHTIHAIALLRILSFFFIVINFFQALQSIFSSLQMIKVAQGIDVIRMRSIACGVIAAVWFRILTIQLFAFIWVIGCIIATIAAYYFYNKRFGWLHTSDTRWDKKDFLKHIRYAGRVLLGSNAYFLLGQLDLQFSHYYFGSEQAGYWTNFMSLFGAVNMVNAPLLGYLFPLLNELREKKEYKKIILLKRYLYFGVGCIGIIAGSIAYFRGPTIAVLLFGPSYSISGALFRQMAPFLWLAPLRMLQFQNLASLGMVKQRVVILISGLTVNLITNYLLISTMGVIGLAYGLIIGQITMVILASIATQRHH